MNEYVENEGKLSLHVSDSANSVNIKVQCQYGTRAQVSFYRITLKTVGCGEEKVVDSAGALKGDSVDFNGECGNPGGGQIKIVHTIYEEGGNELIYTFPDDYTGQPDFDETDQEPSYVFNVNFI